MPRHKFQLDMKGKTNIVICTTRHIPPATAPASNSSSHRLSPSLSITVVSTSSSIARKQPLSR
ncbi:hypothetical protein E2542_SST00057 [Spatholobus suberectus]|nr:hypothetical protein E2542_SST00057 [Spatholobus suberectus]